MQSFILSWDLKYQTHDRIEVEALQPIVLGMHAIQADLQLQSFILSWDLKFQTHDRSEVEALQPTCWECMQDRQT